MRTRTQSAGALAIAQPLIAMALMCAAAQIAWAEPSDYSFKKVAVLGSAAPGGGNFAFGLEPCALSNLGEVAFVASLSTGGQGVFAGRLGNISQITRTGQAAPGGGVFSTIALGRVALNATGDVVFAFTLDPLTLPLGSNSGVYRFSQTKQILRAVVIPNVTPAPGGGTFAGTYDHTGLNNVGDLVFSGMVTGADIDPTANPGLNGLGLGVFRADKQGNIAAIVRPGDPAPGGGTFDWASNAWINDAGDIAFGAHVSGEECIDFGNPQSVAIFCAESVYLRDAESGTIQSIAHQGSAAPGGGTYRLAFGPVVNNRGDVVFIGDLTPAPGAGSDLGVFLFSKGVTLPVARPGDALPGGGELVTASFFDSNYHINNRGDVSFSARLDTDVNSDGLPDTGLYVFSGGAVSLVARTDTVIPGLGTIASIGVGSPSPSSTGAVLNDKGDVLFFATLSDGTGALLLASPK